MKSYTLYWLTGDKEIVRGSDISQAMTQAGYGSGAVRALDFHTEGEDTNYFWDSVERKWKRKEVESC